MYMHLNTPAYVEEGEAVTRGQVIGQMGNTGASTATLCALFFLDETNGYYGKNINGIPGVDSPSKNELVPFTYEISGNDITINISNSQNHGKVIGRNGLVLSSFRSNNAPAVFVTLNR